MAIFKVQRGGCAGGCGRGNPTIARRSGQLSAGRVLLLDQQFRGRPPTSLVLDGRSRLAERLCENARSLPRRSSLSGVSKSHAPASARVGQERRTHLVVATSQLRQGAEQVRRRKRWVASPGRRALCATRPSGRAGARSSRRSHVQDHPHALAPAPSFHPCVRIGSTSASPIGFRARSRTRLEDQVVQALIECPDEQRTPSERAGTGTSRARSRGSPHPRRRRGLRMPPARKRHARRRCHQRALRVSFRGSASAA
jgi:hypothetical protein